MRPLIYGSTDPANSGRSLLPWASRAGSAQARPQVAGTDRDHQDADQAADQDVGQAGLDPGTGIGAGQATDTQGDAGWPVRGYGAVLVGGQDGEGDDARHRGHERGGQGGWGDLGGTSARADQDGCQDRAAADAVDSANAAHRGGQDHQDRDGDQPGRASGILRAGWPGECQPDAERRQYGGDDQVEDAGPGQKFDPDDGSGDDTGQGPGDEHQGQAPAGLPLPPVPV